MEPFTHCRCGADLRITVKGKVYLKRDCPNQDDGKVFVYHDVIAQRMNHTFVNWTVKPEGDKFRAYAGMEESPMLFDTEDDAWVELDQIYWGHKDWPECE